jgi:phenylpropionate dioxygenase-like ring-hydroxylating dioxygenase large terminal subunit
VSVHRLPTSEPRPPAPEFVARAIAEHRPGHALAAPFYCDARFFEHEMQRLLLRHWHCVGHSSQLSATGDFMTVEILGESLIIVRGAEGVHALVNVCRHRGSRVCVEERGHARGGVFVCPYHAWSYNLDGSLRAARQMPAQFERASHGMRTLHVADVEGLLFVSFAGDPPGLEHVYTVLGSVARAYGWKDARVAHRETYVVQANWKLAVENYMECYHCGPAHEEYSRFHLYARPAALNHDADEQLRERTRALGVSIPEFDLWGRNAAAGQESADSLRSALTRGAVTGSEDGKPLAPLMGSFPDYDGGVTFFDIGLTNNFLAYPDHGLMYRFVPRSVERTDMEVLWLVRADAREGIDYDLARLTWLWKVTSVADKRIIELNQKGIRSRYYQAGPYAPMEQHTARVVDWLLAELL